jgi:hypothetical protein
MWIKSLDFVDNSPLFFRNLPWIRSAGAKTGSGTAAGKKEFFRRIWNIYRK